MSSSLIATEMPFPKDDHSGSTEASLALLGWAGTASPSPFLSALLFEYPLIGTTGSC